MASASLANMEELCSHPIFSKSIKQVEINCSYYDKCMAESIGVYGDHCGYKLYQNLEMSQRGGCYPADGDTLFLMSDECRAFRKEGFFESNPKLTEKQNWLLDIHRQYQRLYEDQERVKTGNTHIQRICTALSKLPQLHSISLSDDPYHPGTSYLELSDADIRETCLLASTWKGDVVTAFLTRPPIEIIPDLFAAMAQTEIRPTNFTIDVKPPTDLRCLKLQEPAQQAIKTVLSRAQNLSFKMQEWARKDSLAEDNSRPRSEMLALCSLTSAFFDTPTLKTLEFSFDEFPAYHEPPMVSISDILPMGSQTWPQLHTLSLRYVPLTIADAELLVRTLRGHLKRFHCWNHPRVFPKQEVEEYVLRGVGPNPLPHYFSIPDPDDIVPVS